MIYVTGDFHGMIQRFGKTFLPEEPRWTAADYLIICGDFGFLFQDDEEEQRQLDEIAKKPYTILWVDGNHENFHALARYPVEEWHGGRIHRIRDNLFHLMRGQVFEIDGSTFFTMGGAYSIDRAWRKKDESYWEEEQPTDEEYKEAAKNLKKHDFNVDYVLTHTAPAEIIRRMNHVPDRHDAELTGFLDWVMYETKFRHWFFGHWHYDHDIGEQFSALYYDVKKIGESNDEK